MTTLLTIPMKRSIARNVRFVESRLCRAMVDRQLVQAAALWIASRKGGQSELSKDECYETHTGYIAGENRAYIYSEDKSWIKKMERWLIDFPDDVILKLKTKYGMEVEYPIEWFMINSPAKKRQKSDLKSQK